MDSIRGLTEELVGVVREEVEMLVDRALMNWMMDVHTDEFGYIENYCLKEDTRECLELISEVLIKPTIAFKKEFIALGLDEDTYSVGQQALDPFDIYDRLIDVGLDGQANASEELRQMSYDYSHLGSAPTTNLLNPVAWAQFLNAIKRGDLRGN